MCKLLKDRIEELCSDFDGRCGAYISVPHRDEVCSFNADRIFPSASTIKIPLLALLLKCGEEGLIDLDEKVPLDKGDVARGSGIIKYLSPDIALSLYDYAVLMIIVSDNTATNKIIDAVGIEAANAFFDENGWHDTHLYTKLHVPTAEHPNGVASNNTTSVKDLADMLTRIHNKTLVSESVSEKMLRIMACQQLGKLDKDIPGVIRLQNSRAPVGVIPDGRVLMAQKGGTLTNVLGTNISHDTAIMILPDGRSAIMVVMTEGSNRNALDLMKNIGLTVYENII